MAEKRSLWDRLFGRFKATAPQRTVVVDSTGGLFTNWSGDPYLSDIVRGAIDAIARNGAKLKPRHIRRINGKVLPPASTSLERLLQIRPNPRMSTYDFLYKMIATLYIQNNAFAYPEWDAMGRLVAVWPVTCHGVSFSEDPQGVTYITFHLPDGTMKTLPYSDVIHLRRHYTKGIMVGDDNAPIKTTLEVIATTDAGMAKAVKSSANLRGLLTFPMILKPEDLKQARDDFVKDYLSLENASGVAALDKKAEYTEFKTEPKIINAPQMQELRDRVYRYFGINEKIVMGKYTEDEWNAFYESVLEPIALMLGLEFTAKLFTERERGHGNEIVFEANRLQYASVGAKLNLREMVDRGALTPNEWREAFNLGPIPGGDKPLRRLDTGVVKPSGDIGNDDKGGDDDGGDAQEGDPNGGAQGGGGDQ